MVERFQNILQLIRQGLLGQTLDPMHLLAAMRLLHRGLRHLGVDVPAIRRVMEGLTQKITDTWNEREPAHVLYFRCLYLTLRVEWERHPEAWKPWAGTQTVMRFMQLDALMADGQPPTTTPTKRRAAPVGDEDLPADDADDIIDVTLSPDESTILDLPPLDPEPPPARKKRKHLPFPPLPLGDQGLPIRLGEAMDVFYQSLRATGDAPIAPEDFTVAAFGEQIQAIEDAGGIARFLGHLPAEMLEHLGMSPSDMEAELHEEFARFKAIIHALSVREVRFAQEVPQGEVAAIAAEANVDEHHVLEFLFTYRRMRDLLRQMTATLRPPEGDAEQPGPVPPPRRMNRPKSASPGKRPSPTGPRKRHRLTRRTWLNIATHRLRSGGIEAPRLVAEVILSHVLEISREEILAHDDLPMVPRIQDQAYGLVSERLRGVPLAYLVGSVEFYSLRFLVDESVLIPRNETELLVDRIKLFADERAADGPWRLLDLGTGSGVIAVTAAVETDVAMVTATDVSPEALRIADTNAYLLGVSERMEFFEGDWWEALPDERRGTFDVIVSNPPYIDPAERPQLRREVTVQPEQALFAGKPGRGGLQAYDAIIPEALGWLRPGGLLGLEIGAGQAPAVEEWLRHAGFEDVTSTADLASIPRMVCGTKPNAASGE